MLRQKRLRSIDYLKSGIMIMIQQGASPITTNMLRMCGGTIERKFSGTLVLGSFQLRRGHPKQVGASRYSSPFVSGFIFLFGQQQSAQFRYLSPPFHPTFGGNDGILLPIELAAAAANIEPV